MPGAAASSNGALPSPSLPQLKSPKKGSSPKKKLPKIPEKRKRKAAEEEDEGEDAEPSEDDMIEEEKDVKPEPPKFKTKSKPKVVVHKDKPVVFLPPPPVEVYDEFLYWPKPVGMPLLEKASLRHNDTVEKELKAIWDARDAATSTSMDVDLLAPPPADLTNGASSSTSTGPRSSRRLSVGGPPLSPSPTVSGTIPSPPPPPPPPPILPIIAVNPPKPVALLPSEPAAAYTTPALPPTKPARRAPKKPTTSDLVAGRAPRFNTPWGVKMPEIVGWKNEFDLDGE